VTRDLLCIVCGRRCGEKGQFLYLRPNPHGGQHQAMGLCGQRCGQAYAGEPRRPPKGERA